MRDQVSFPLFQKEFCVTKIGREKNLETRRHDALSP